MNKSQKFKVAGYTIATLTVVVSIAVAIFTDYTVDDVWSKTNSGLIVGFILVCIGEDDES